ncbi:heavy-metal-associated domain-containing protein [Maribellus sp. YY47]|uniref:heavy-metal-associated domain-containing protein n=1 Tax=Maribellus sp. YY47 TaxID=2929486 RepID=UPI00200137FA|nr:heavy-metal-associated domain-containing protein [Maribellus sp. YY47]MCK3683780.1 heavy-metal-associated domain-containing protein [Maribellus sp. YY47]
MELIKIKTNLSCKHCVMKVEPLLKRDKGIIDYKIDLEHPDKLLTLSSEGADIDALISDFKNAGYQAKKL